jgi:GATA-binding protein
MEDDSAPSLYEPLPPREDQLHAHSPSQPLNSLLHHHHHSPQNTSDSSEPSPNQSSSLSPSSPFGSSLDQSPARLLQDPIFPAFKDDASNLETPDILQSQDPLGTQIWKLFSNTKAQLPNSDRFQNIAWRMMHMNLKRLESQKRR